MRQLNIGAVLLVMLVTTPVHAADGPKVDPLEIITRALDLTRGQSSYAEMTMFIKRPTWERRSSLAAWTRGRDESLIRFTAPAKDAGNALLKQHEKMWTFNPKLNRSIRLPGSMMGQSWGGSDFSYDDLSRTDKYLRDYSLELIDTRVEDGVTIYTIDAIPHDDAPVVWGKERLVIREDAVMIEMVYYDQDLMPLKKMASLEIGELGGRTFATRMRMGEIDEPDSYTEMSYQKIDFDVDLDDRLFTVFSLQSGRTP